MYGLGKYFEIEAELRKLQPILHSMKTSWAGGWTFAVTAGMRLSVLLITYFQFWRIHAEPDPKRHSGFAERV